MFQPQGLPHRVRLEEVTHWSKTTSMEDKMETDKLVLVLSETTSEVMCLC